MYTHVQVHFHGGTFVHVNQVRELEIMYLHDLAVYMYIYMYIQGNDLYNNI